MTDATYDIVVIGAGPGGYIAAIRAAQIGFKVAIVEREHLGGVCLNWGCIPTKALLRGAELLRLAQHAGAYGIEVPRVSVNLGQLVKRSRAVSEQLREGVKYLLKKNRVTVFDGHGMLAGRERVGVTREGKPVKELAARHIILATGARARVIPGMEPDGKVVWSYKEAMLPEVLPKSVLVVGAGAIGIEFASLYRTLGAEVTVLEAMDRILPAEDDEISALARTALEKQGINIRTASTIASLSRKGKRVTAAIESAHATSELSADRVIIAVGISPNTENLGLEGTRVRFNNSHLVVNQWLETDEPGVYAIGDLTNPPWLAHKASREAVICVERIAGMAHVQPLDVRAIPGCTYSHPQVASVGLTESEAREAGFEPRIGRFPLHGNGRAITMGEAEGLVKTIFDSRTGELLGAHMIGPEVTEMIQGFAIARTLEATESDLINTIFPHPTLSETMHESVLDAFGRSLHH